VSESHARPLQVLVLGLGAMGTAVAGLLAHHTRAAVTIAGKWTAALDAIRQHGALVEGQESTLSCPMRALEPAQIEDGFADAVLVLVKSTGTVDAAPVAARARCANGLVVTLQNGLGNREILAAAAGKDNVLAGVAGIGATLLAPGRVRLFPGSLAIGAPPEIAPRLNPLAAALSRAGLPPNISPDTNRVLWTKLAVNCAINPVAALYRQPNGRLLAIPQAQKDMLDAATEVAAVAAAKGIGSMPDVEALVLLAAERTADNVNSMLHDVLRRVSTEIESLNGAVVREAHRLGVPVPVNERLLAAVRDVDAANSVEPTC
jgi:2-dehydropantoate 2-reductase